MRPITCLFTSSSSNELNGVGKSVYLRVGLNVRFGRGVCMSREDVEYYRRRANAERRMALEARRQDVAAIHEELARQYQALVDEAGLRPKLSLKFAALSRVSQSPG
jgi:predicted glycoside hydrolase/deacetylase ChbG (UPF0249 family)